MNDSRSISPGDSTLGRFPSVGQISVGSLRLAERTDPSYGTILSGVIFFGHEKKRRVFFCPPQGSPMDFRPFIGHSSSFTPWLMMIDGRNKLGPFGASLPMMVRTSYTLFAPDPVRTCNFWIPTNRVKKRTSCQFIYFRPFTSGMKQLHLRFFIGVYMGVSWNGGTQQPLVFLLKMIILGCFGGITI